MAVTRQPPLTSTAGSQAEQRSPHKGLKGGDEGVEQGGWAEWGDNGGGKEVENPNSQVNVDLQWLNHSVHGQELQGSQRLCT